MDSYERDLELFRATAQFEDAMTRVAMVTGKEYDRLAPLITEAAVQSGYSASDLANSIEYAATWGTDFSEVETPEDLFDALRITKVERLAASVAQLKREMVRKTWVGRLIQNIADWMSRVLSRWCSKGDRS